MGILALGGVLLKGHGEVDIFLQGERRGEHQQGAQATSSSSRGPHLCPWFSWARSEIPPPVGETVWSPRTEGHPAFMNLGVA